MKTFFLTTLALLSFGMAMAHNTNETPKIHTIIVNTSGDVTLYQSNEFRVDGESTSKWNVNDGVLTLLGSGDFFVTFEDLAFLKIASSGDVFTNNTIKGDHLYIDFFSSGDSRLDLDYKDVYVRMSGSGDLKLQGQCGTLFTDKYGSGDLVIDKLNVSKNIAREDIRAIPDLSGLSELLAELGTNLEALSDSVDWKSFEADMERWGESMEAWGRKMEEWGDRVESDMREYERSVEKTSRDIERWGNGRPDVVPQPDVRVEKRNDDGREGRPRKKSLVFDPHWSGVDAGLNLLLGPGTSANFEGDYAFLEIRPLKSWNFNFNIADVGIAFNRRHVAGLYTGIGLGWNNYSFNQPVRIVKGESRLEGHWIDEGNEGKVKKSKLGVLYVQAPLMLEVRPSRNFFIAAGVTGGIRIDAWTKVKFENKNKEKHHSDFYLNPLKLDATLRAGGDDFGFFASFDILPVFVESNGPTAHTFNVGFSLIF